MSEGTGADVEIGTGPYIHTPRARTETDGFRMIHCAGLSWRRQLEGV